MEIKGLLIWKDIMYTRFWAEIFPVDVWLKDNTRSEELNYVSRV